MGPIAAGIVGGALSIFGGAARNRAIQRQADDNFNNTLLSLGIQRGVEENNLLFQADEVNRQIGAELSNILSDARKARASTIVEVGERNVYGATALRTVAQVDRDAAGMIDNVVQSGTAAMTNVQTNLTNSMYKYNQGVYTASQNRANAMSQKQSSFEILAGAVGTGFNFASGYRSMKGM